MEKNDVVRSNVLIVLNILDVVTTVTVLNVGCLELNPLMRRLVENVPLILFIKVIASGVVAHRLYTIHKESSSEQSRRRAKVVLMVCNAFYAVVVIINIISATVMIII